MFSQFKLSGRIVGTIVVVLLFTSVLSFWITQRRINRQAEEAFRDKVRQITGMASTTREWFSDNLDTLVPDRNFKDLNQVPVVAAWRVAKLYAKDNDMTFHTPSLNPRNPKNLPDDFERRAPGGGLDHRHPAVGQGLPGPLRPHSQSAESGGAFSS